MEQVKHIKTVKCPTCGASVAWSPENVYRPFCSERCKLIDLGAWADSSYAIAASDDDIMSEDASRD